jgi:autotransporter-associated beta strand protein
MIALAAAAAIAGLGNISRGQNVADNVVTGASADLGNTPGNYSMGSLPSSTNDLVFANSTYSVTAFTLSSANLTPGTLDDLDATQAIAITGTDSFTLEGGSNSVAPSTADLLYIASGGALSVGTPIVLTTAAASGNFDVAGNLSISGIISGTGFGFTKTGAGELLLSGSNTFTGGLTISAGTIVANNNLNLGASTGAISLNGGELEATTGFTNTHAITIGASGGTINVGGYATQQLAFNTASTLIGSGALTVTGSNLGNGDDVRLEQAQTGFVGNLTVQNDGVVEYGVATALGSAATITLNSTGELAINSGITTNANATTINGGILSFENGTTGNFAGAISLGNAGGTIGLRDYYGLNTVRSGTISGAISGNGSLTVNSGGGAGGTLTLSAADGYTGATTVNNANLAVNGANGAIASSSAYSINNGILTADFTSNTAAHLNSAANATFTTGGGLALTGNGTTNTTQSIGTLGIGQGADTVTITNGTAARTTTLAAAGLSRWQFGTVLVRGTNLGDNQGTSPNDSAITLASTAGLPLVGTNTLNNAGSLDATPALQIVPFLFGDVSATGNGSNFVTYDATLGLRTLTTAEDATLSAGYTTATNPDNALGFNGTITSPTGITLNSLLFNTTGQTLNGSGGALTINSGALAVVGTSATSDTIGSGFTSLALGNGEGVITVTSGNALAISTPITITSGGGLTKTGAGTLTIGSSDTYTGQTTINQGTLTTGVTNSFNGSTGTALQVNSGGTLNINNTTQTITTLDLTGTGAVVNATTGGTLSLGGTVTYDSSTNPGPGATISVSDLALNGTQVFNIGGVANQWSPYTYNQAGTKQLNISSAIVNGSGTGGITKNGPGVLEISGTGNTYSGPTTVNAGVLYFLGTSSQGAPNSAITVNSGATLAAQVSVQNTTETIGNSLTLNGASAIFGTNDNPNGAAGRENVYKFTNALTLSSGSNTVALNSTQNGGFGSEILFGSVSRSAGASVLFLGRNLGLGGYGSNAGDNNIVFTTGPTLVGGGGAIGTTTTSIIPWGIGDTGNYQGSYYLANGLGTDFVTYGGSGVELLTTYAGSITSGASALNNVKVTDSSVTGINASTTINSLILNSAAASAGSPGTSAVDGTATLTLNSGALLVTTTSTASSYGGTNGSYGGLFTNNATIGTSGLTLAFGSNEAIITTAGPSILTDAGSSGGLTGTGGLTKSGAGTLILNAADTISGNTIIDAGTIVLGNSAALQDSVLSYNSQGGTLAFSSTSTTLGGLNGSQNLPLTTTTGGNVALTVGGPNNLNSSYSGVLSGGGSLIKAGSGSFGLSGASTYTGGTSINAGTLALTGSILSPVTVNGGTLVESSTGLIGTGGSLSVSSGLASLAGTNTYTGATSINSGGTLSLNNGTLGSTAVTVNGGGVLAAVGAANKIGGSVAVAGGTTSLAQGQINLTTSSSPTTVLNIAGGLTLGGASSGQVAELSFVLSPTTNASDLINLGSSALTGDPGGAQINIGTSPLANATYTLIDYGSDTGLTVGTNLTLGTHPSALGTTYTLNLSSSALTVTVSGTTAPTAAYWTGLQGDSYNWGDHTGASTNWATNAAGTTDTAQVPGASSDVVFAANNATSASLNTSLETGYTINSLTIRGSATDPTLSTAPVIGGTGSLTIGAAASGAGGLGYSAGTGIVINSNAAGLTISAAGGVIVPGSQSWTNNSAAAFAVSSGITTDAVSGTTTLALSNSSTGSTNLSNAIGDGSAGGKLALSINNTGSGVTVLSGANSYSGGTTLTAGTLDIANASALGTGTLAITSGNIDNTTGGSIALSGNNPQVWNGSYTFLDSSSLNMGTGAVTLGTSPVITVNGSGALVVGGNIGSSAHGITKAGSGTLVLNGSGAYTGGFTINAGVVQAGSNTALGTGSLNFGASSNGTLLVNGNSVTVAGLNADSTATIQNADSSAGTLAVNTAASNTFSGALQNGTGAGALGLNVGGAGTLVLNGTNNTYSGPTNINGGTLEFDNASAMSSSSALTIGNGATLSLRADTNTTFTPASVVAIIGGNTSNIVVNPLTTATGQTLILNGETYSDAGGANNGTVNISSSNGYTLQFGTSGAYQLSGNSGAAFGGTDDYFNLNGANVIFNGMNDTSAAGDDILVLSSATGNSLTINGTVSVLNNRTAGAILNSGILTLNNTVTGAGGANTGFWVNVNGGTLNVNNAGAINNNDYAAHGNYGFVIAGGVLNNTSGAAVTLSANPVIQLNGDFAFGSATATSANNLNLGTGTVSLGTAAIASRTITTHGSAALTLGGAIINGTNATTPTTGLTTAGSGTVILSATSSTYTGSTNVIGGVLDVTGAIASSGSINVSASNIGATLILDGTNALNSSAPITGTTTGTALPLITVNSSQNLGAITNAGTTNFSSGTSTVASFAGTGTLVVAAPVTLTVGNSLNHGGIISSGTINVNAGSSNIITGSIDDPSVGHTSYLRVANAANLSATHIVQGVLDISTGSTVTIPSNPAGAFNPTSTTPSPTISVVNDLYNNGGSSSLTSGTLDLKNNALIVNDPNEASSIIAAVYNAADFNPNTGSNQWDQAGITSSSALANAGTYALGSLTGTELTNLGSTTFQGLPVTGNSTVVAYTLIGDTELRGTVDGTDYNNVLANYDTAGDWSQGNFYNESIVSGDDYNAVLNAYDVAAAGGAKGLKPAITRSLSPALSPVATSGTFHLEVNVTSGDVVIFNDSTSSAPLTLYNIVDGSQQDLLIGNPADANGTSGSIESGSPPYTNEHFLSVAQNDSNAVASITGRSSTNYKAWSLVLDGYNSNATALALSEGGVANKTDTINVPSYYSIDLGDIFNVGTTTVALTFQWGTETSAGGEGGTVYSSQPIDYVGTPEPASLGLLGLGGLAMMRRRRKTSR